MMGLYSQQEHSATTHYPVWLKMFIKCACKVAASFKLSSRVLLSLNHTVLSKIITDKIGKQGNTLKPLKGSNCSHSRNENYSAS